MSYRPFSLITPTRNEYEKTNNTGVTINKGTPVIINTAGDVAFVDVSIESEILSVSSVAAEDIPNGELGKFVVGGVVTNLSTVLDFGDTIYISKSGGLTDTHPSEGIDGFVSGDFICRLGVIAKNNENPTLKDLIVTIYIIGQL